jgi:hypothetical protein
MSKKDLYIPSVLLSKKKRHYVCFLSFVVLISFLISVFTLIPRPWGDYHGYMQLFLAGGGELVGARIVEIISISVYYFSKNTIPELGFFIFSSLASFYLFKTTSRLNNLGVNAYFFFSLFIVCYLFSGYLFYVRQYLALVIFIFFISDGKTKSAFLGVLVSSLVHVNSGLIFLGLVCLAILYQRFKILKLILLVSILLASIQLAFPSSLSISKILSDSISYGWYFANFESNPIKRIIYEIFLATTVWYLFYTVRYTPEVNVKNNYHLVSAIPIVLISLVLSLEALLPEFGELLNRVTLYMDGLILVAIFFEGKRVNFYKKTDSFTVRRCVFFVLPLIISLHGLSRGIASHSI